MQRNDDTGHNRQQYEKSQSEPESIQVPSTLLPDLLARLGLTSEPKSSTLSLADLLIQVKCEDWEVRSSALSALGRLSNRSSVDVFVSALSDEDATVRATALHALGEMGRLAPLHPLLTALQDPDWHVRETAVFALGKQGLRVPLEVFQSSLQDPDASVQDAAKIVLQWKYADEEAFTSSYGYLWEKKSMQDQLSEQDRSNSINALSDVLPSGLWDGPFIENGRNSYSSRVLKEQAQVYASQGYASQNQVLHESTHYSESEYNTTASSYGEKITHSYSHRKLHKAWWALVPVFVLLFLLLGRFSTLILPQSSLLPVSQQSVSVSVGPSQSPQDEALGSSPFSNPAFTGIISNEVSTALHLTVQQLVIEVEHKGSISAVAAVQGISSTQLKTIELKAAQDAIDAAAKANIKPIGISEGIQLNKQVQEDPQLLERIVQKSLDIYVQYS